MNKSKSLLVAIALAAAASTQAASFTLVNAPVGATTGSLPGGVVGHLFSVSGPGVSVDSLGFVDVANDGVSAITVSIYDYVGTPGSGTLVNLLGSATINGTSPHINDFRWENFSGGPINLGAGVYGIVVNGTSVDPVGDTFSGDSAPTFNSGNGVAWVDDISGGFIGGTLIHQSAPRWKVVNMEFTPVPEPETYAMIAGVGLVAFGLWRRRQ